MGPEPTANEGGTMKPIGFRDGRGQRFRDRSFYKVAGQKSGSSVEEQGKHQTYLLIVNKVKCVRMNSVHLRELTGKPYFSGGKVEGLM